MSINLSYNLLSQPSFKEKCVAPKKAIVKKDIDDDVPNARSNVHSSFTTAFKHNAHIPG